MLLVKLDEIGLGLVISMQGTVAYVMFLDYDDMFDELFFSRGLNLVLVGLGGGAIPKEGERFPPRRLLRT